MTVDSNILTTLDELVATISGCDDPRHAGGEWKQVFKLLQKTGLPAGRIAHVTGMRDAGMLTALVDELRSPEADAEPTEAPSDEDCKKAFQAFKKRLKLTILDEESKLGRSPLSKGSEASTAAIVPPGEWPDAVWQELARQGKLHYVRDGFYEMGKH
jgi:hypothetical protein